MQQDLQSFLSDKSTVVILCLLMALCFLFFLLAVKLENPFVGLSFTLGTISLSVSFHFVAAQRKFMNTTVRPLVLLAVGIGWLFVYLAAIYFNIFSVST